MSTLFVPRRTALRTPQRAKSRPENGEPLYPMKSSTRSAALCIACSAFMRRVLGIPPHRRIEHRAGPTIETTRLPSLRLQCRKQKVNSQKIYRLS